MHIPGKRSPFVQTFLIGLMALLPLALTVGVISWIAGIVKRFLGPDSVLGGLLVRMGLPFVDSTTVAYLVGGLMVVAAVYVLGLLLQIGLKGRLKRLLDGLIGRIPVIGSVYDLAGRLVGMFEPREGSNLKSMAPVWCSFGGEGGTTVLALLPSPEPVEIGGHRFLGVLVPSAPVPVGGGLLFVPVDWVRPAAFGVEGLTSIYVSMGATAPSVLAGKTPAVRPDGGMPH
ncbi:MAG: DUF502 domain-containing protein [Chromatiaceae bacterium]|nr:DUF502 domain-containing protein [Chromatiaceae bacterium]